MTVMGEPKTHRGAHDAVSVAQLCDATPFATGPLHRQQLHVLQRNAYAARARLRIPRHTHRCALVRPRRRDDAQPLGRRKSRAGGAKQSLRFRGHSNAEQRNHSHYGGDHEIRATSRCRDSQVGSEAGGIYDLATRAYPIASQAEYTARYRALARDIGAIIAPVGVAWQRLESQGIELFDGSGSHPNLAGSYLEACVFYATLTGKSPIGATHTFDLHFDIPEAYRESLQHDKVDARTAAA